MDITGCFQERTLNGPASAGPLPVPHASPPGGEEGPFPPNCSPVLTDPVLPTSHPI